MPQPPAPTLDAPTPAFRPLLDAFRARLSDAVRPWLAAKRTALAGTAPAAAELVDALGTLFESGGKRLRPALVYHGYRATGGTRDADVLPLAMAVEFLHAFLLIHDDIMDHAALRRGQPTTHIRFRDLHAAQDWPGAAAAYGEAVAILVGDLAHVYAIEAMVSTPVPGARRAALTTAFLAMEEEVIAGQHLEMRLALARDADEATLRKVLQLKSGRYTVQRPLELGALLAGATAAQHAALARYGAAVGEAFQLQDDVLGLFGDPTAVGKPVGGDLGEGKYTLLIHHTLAEATPADRRTVEAALGDAALPPEAVAAVCDIIRRSGALDRIHRRIEACLEDARRALDTAAFDATGRAFLVGLTAYLHAREH